MKYTIFLLSLLAGCTPKPTMTMFDNTQLNDRVTVQRIGVFEDGLAYNQKRGIYIIRDKETGKEFIGVSGVGIAETGKHLAGKVMLSDER